MKCPFCQTELEKTPSEIRLFGCPKCLHIADGLFWVKTTQAEQILKFLKEEIDRSATALIERTKELDACQKDLKVARKALEEVVEKAKVVVRGCEYIGTGIQRVARKALEQIEHKE